MTKPKLLDRVREQIRLRHYSIRTEKTYTYEIGDKFVRAKRSKHIPVVFTKEEVQNVLSKLNGVYRLVANLI